MMQPVVAGISTPPPSATGENPLPNPELAMAFLDWLDAGMPAGFRALIAIWPKKNDFSPTMCFYALGDRADRWRSLQALAQLRGTTGIYFGLGILAQPPKRGRGLNEDIIALGQFAADVDEKDFPSVAAMEKAVVEGLLGLGLRPSAVISSGHGQHLYWRLAQPLTLPADLERYRGVQRAIAERLSGDKIVDPSRCLRLPGTLNLKGVPVPCQVIDWGKQVYAPRAFPQAAMPAGTRNKRQVPQAMVEHGSPADLPWPDGALLDRFFRLSRGNQRLGRFLVDNGDGRQSEMDFHLTFALLAIGGMNGREAIAIARWRRNRDASWDTHQDKLSRPDYWERTLQAATAQVDRKSGTGSAARERPR